MAVPTITNVSPAEGHPGGGQIITLTGTNFKTGAATPYLEEPNQNTVSVTVGGVDAEHVRVISATTIEVAVPPYGVNPNATIQQTQRAATATPSRIAFPAVDIVTTNLDDDGVAVPGETVTEVGGYTYVQPLLYAPEGDPPLYQVLRAFMHLLKRQVLSNVSWLTHTDFGVDGASITELSEHPSIGMRMAIERDREYGQFDNSEILVPNGDGTWAQYDPPTTYMLVIPVTISASNEITVQHMVAAVMDAPMATPWLEVAADPGWNVTTPNRYPLELIAPPEQIASLNRVNVVAFQATFRVRGIPIVRSDPSVARIFAVSEIHLFTGNAGGTAFSEMSWP